MTRDQLRRRYIVTTPEIVGEILKFAFLIDDEKSAINQTSFNVYFMSRSYPSPTVDLAWEAYKHYHDELARYEPTPHE